jgi:NADH-quinone oxidoreductase subunit A
MLNITFLSILLFFSLSVGLSTVILLLSLALSAKADEVEKLSAYECGFNPFFDSRNEFNVRFYIVAILFLIFDLEISFLFPFTVTMDCLKGVYFFSMLIFLSILTIGFFYEWKKGALDWS